MFGGDPNPNPIGTGPSPNPTSGRFFVNTVWRSGENKPSSSGDNNETAVSEPSTSTRQGFGTFSKALEQLRRDSSSVRKQNAALTNQDVLSLQSLYVADIPANLLQKDLLIQHFSLYGKITRITISVKRKSCILHFENHEMAENAKTHGAILEQTALNIYWSRPATSSRRSTERKLSESSHLAETQVEDSSGERKPAAEKSEKAQYDRPRPHSLPKFDIPDEVQEELQAMVTCDILDDHPVPLKKSPKKLLPKKVSASKHAIKKKINLGEKVPSSTSSRSKHAATDAEVVYSSTASIEELRKIMRTPCRSAEDRYRVLEARDKLMRMKRVRQSDIMKARKNRGTCPDMCPEKERYHREYQRQVASYEQFLPGKMDPRKAVKEYSRSSADQEEPLSHELRPAPVLRMTMDHLVWDLMDLCNGPEAESLADWYHFIWDRTRSIRKDITQQDLSDESAVLLVERCARWHAFCSERMMAEGAAAYDDQINTENLTKCLQTLKYMYHDLSLRGVVCPHEAEFRAYFVLLNLDEGACMREVQQLRVGVERAEPIRFAIQVSAALSSNNFVRFFKLVRSATYLNACILHRYFAQVRSRALLTILRAYCSRVDTVFSLDEVVHLTGFESTQEAALLCSHHGLKLTDDGTGVIFSRTSYCQPDSVLTTARNRSLIEAKRPGSVAEIVSGGIPPQSEYQTHVPHDSFDADGLLKAEAWKDVDQQQSDQQQSNQQQSNQQQSRVQGREDPERSREPIDAEAQLRRHLLDRALCKQMDQTAEELIVQVVEDEVCSIVERSMKEAHVEEATRGLCEEVMEVVVADLVEGVCKEVITAEVCLARERMRAKQLALEADMRNKLIENKASLELASAIDSAMREICEGVIEEEIARDGAAGRWAEDILGEVVREECQAAVDLVLGEARDRKLAAILARARSRRLAYFFSKWRGFVNRSKRQHESMVDFPAWMSCLSLEEQVSGLERPDPSYLARLVEKRRPGTRSTDRATLTTPTVDVPSAVARHLKSRRFWKAVVSLPDAVESPATFESCPQWTESVFSLDAASTLVARASTPGGDGVGVAMRCVTGPVTDVDACSGVNGVFFWLPHRDTNTKAACRRLLAVLSAKPQRPAIPVALVWTGPPTLDRQTTVRELALEKLKESKFLSQYRFLVRDGNTRTGLARQMQCACEWLARCAPGYPPLVVISMRQLANLCLTDELWEHIHENNGSQSPNVMVDVYNGALLKLREHLGDVGMKQYSLGAAEFQPFLNDDFVYKDQCQYQIAPAYWGSKHYFSTIANFVSAAQLAPVLPWPPPSSQELKKTLCDYCTSQGIPHIVSDLYLILERHHSSKQRASFPPPTPSNWRLFLETLPWSRVLQAIAEAKLGSLDYGFVSRNLSNQDSLLVVIHRNSLQRFRCSPWWITGPDSTHRPSEVFKSDEKRQVVALKRPLINETNTPKKHQRLSLSDTLTQIKEVVSKLDSTMKCAKVTREEIEAKYDSQ